MTATDTTASAFVVAIDISKYRHEVLIGAPGKKRRRRLTILAAQVGLQVEDCDDAAWHEIKDRKDRVIDGVMVKEADL